MCYLYIAILCGLGLFSVRFATNIFCVAVIAIAFFAPEFLPRFAQNPDSFMLPVCFLTGTFFAINKQIIKIDASRVVLLWFFVLLVNLPTAQHFLFYMAFFYTTIFISSREFVINRFKLPFDASYGVYIYGFMIQQCVHAVFPGMGVHGNQLISLTIALAAGIGSWFFVEKTAISFGSRITSVAWINTKISVMRDILQPVQYIKKSQKSVLIFSSVIMELSILVVLAFIVHAFVLQFVFPGYYRPLTPQHSDFYIPVELANSAAGFLSYASWPRPVGMMFAYFIGCFGIYGSTAIVVLLTILNCALSVTLFRRMLQIDFKWPLIAVFLIYTYLVFSEPYFYIFYAQDILSQLSYFFLLFGFIGFYVMHDRSILGANLCLFIFTMLAFLSKETYGISAIIVAVAWFSYSYSRSLKRAMMPVLVVFGALCLSFGYNVYVKSPFLSSAAYKTDLSPASIFSEWGLYAHEALNIAYLALFVTIVLACYYYFHQETRRRVFYILFGCIIAALCAWLPNALIPGHHFSGYSWNGASILFLPVLLIAKIWTENFGVQNTMSVSKSIISTTISAVTHRGGMRHWLIRNSKNQFVLRYAAGTEVLSGFLIIMLSLVCITNPICNKKDYAKNWWVLAQEDTQRNLLKALNTLIGEIKPENGTESILITGLTFPFSPFDHPSALQTFPNARFINFDVVRYSPFNPRGRIDHVKSIAALDVNSAEYSQIWVFDNDGQLIRRFHRSEPLSKSLLRISV